MTHCSYISSPRCYSFDHRRRDNRPQERNSVPPRFRAGRHDDHLGSYDRGVEIRDRCGRGGPLGAGLSKPRGASNIPSSSGSRRPAIQKQPSNDCDEWETASESSDVLGKDMQNGTDSRCEAPKYPLSSSCHQNERHNRRLASNLEERHSNVDRRSKKDRYQNRKNGPAPPKPPATNGLLVCDRTVPSDQENVTTVMRVDSIISNQPGAISEMFNDIQSRLACFVFVIYIITAL